VQPDSTAELGAPAIEIGVELLSPRLDSNDLPVGSNTAASAASPNTIEQKDVVEQTDQPKAVPTETDYPERVVAVNDAKKPKDDNPKALSVPTNASTLSVATEETATPTVDTARESPHSLTPASGTGDNARRERVTWQKELAVHFDKFKSYSSDRVMQRAEVVVSFTLDRTGHILATRVVRGSGDPSFDTAALAMLQHSDPVPPPPPLVADEGLTFTLPVIFHVKSRY
jgi:periplasmic protein TonB